MLISEQRWLHLEEFSVTERIKDSVSLINHTILSRIMQTREFD